MPLHHHSCGCSATPSDDSFDFRPPSPLFALPQDPASTFPSLIIHIALHLPGHGIIASRSVKAMGQGHEHRAWRMYMDMTMLMLMMRCARCIGWCACPLFQDFCIMSNFPFRTTRDRPGFADSGRLAGCRCQDAGLDRPAANSPPPSARHACTHQASLHAARPTTYEVTHSQRHWAIMKHATTTGRI